MDATASTFEREVMAPLASLGRQLRSRLLVAGLCRFVAIALTLAACQLLLDYLLVLGTGPRAAILLLVGGAAGYQLWNLVLRAAAIRITIQDVAVLMERARPEWRDQLLSAVSFADSPPDPNRDSPEMVRALVEGAGRLFRATPPPNLFNLRGQRRLAALGLASVGFAACACTFLPELTATYVARDLLLQDAAWPSRTRITVEGLVRNRIFWPLGDDFTLVANAEGEVPDSLRSEIELPDGKTVYRDMMKRGENQFLLEYGPLTASMKLRFLIAKFGADESTIWYDVEAMQRPTVSDISISVTPPAYAAQPESKLPAGQTAVEALRGSTLRIDAIASKAIVSGVLRLGGTRILDVTRDSDRAFHVAFAPQSSGSYYFDISDEGGLTDLHPVTIALRLQSDPLPKVRLGLPGAGEMITPPAVLDISAECEDNLGLQSAELLYRVAGEGGTASTQPDDRHEKLPRFEPRMTRYAETFAWPLSSLGCRVGDQVRISLRATDFQPAGASSRASEGVAAGGNATESSVYSLRVVTPEELLAELGRRESEWRREFEQILKSQEQLKKRIEDWHDKAAGATSPGDFASGYAREQTAQRGQASRLKTVRRQFEQILGELRINQLAVSAVRKRLEGGVIEPLTALINVEVPAAADAMESLKTAFSRSASQKVEESQARLLQQMNAILANMLKWEGYNEAVGMLRDVIRLQTDVNRQTQTRAEQQAENLFEPKATSRPEQE